MDLGVVGTKLLADSAGDDAGRSVAGAGDLNGDGLADLLIGANADNDGGREAGAVFLVWSPVTASMDLRFAAAKVVGDQTSSWAGWSVAGAGDVDADGYSDVLVGALWSDRTRGTNPGLSYLVLGPITGTFDLSGADTTMIGASNDDRAGRSVAGGGDLDGDGELDQLIGAPAEDPGMSDAGVTYVVSGARRGLVDLSGADATFTGEDRYDFAGYDVANAGDVSGDGVPDLLIGAYYADGNAPQTGIVYLGLGPVAGAIALADADARLIGESACAGNAVASAGDVDADGVPDLLIGAHLQNEGTTYGGIAYLVDGTTRGTVDLSEADARLVAEDGGDNAGYSVDGAGDTDVDGYADVLVGAVGRAEVGFNAGAAYVVRGPVSGTMSLGDADLRLLAEGPNDEAGRSVAGVGDTDGDGLPDILVGANRDTEAGTDAGAAFLMRSRAD